MRDIYFLAEAPDHIEMDFSELPALLSYAEGIARSTAKALDQPEAVSPAADNALEEIARELGIDHGESWAKLLAELREVQVVFTELSPSSPGPRYRDLGRVRAGGRRLGSI